MEVSVFWKKIKTLELDITDNWISLHHFSWWWLENTQSQPTLLPEKYHSGAIGSEYVVKEHLHPCSNLALGSAGRGQSLQSCSLLHHILDLSQSCVFFLSCLVKSCSKGCAINLHTARGRKAHCIVTSYMGSLINVGRANEQVSKEKEVITFLLMVDYSYPYHMLEIYRMYSTEYLMPG